MAFQKEAATLVPLSCLLMLTATPLWAAKVDVEGGSKDFGNTVLNIQNTATESANYWTPERLRQVKPAELLSFTIPDELKQLFRSVEHKSPTYGNPVQVDATDKPFRHGGLLVFTTPSGASNACTAQFVDNDRVLMTAAHCIMDRTTLQWNRNFMFYQEYRNGKYSKAIDWKCASILSQFEVPGIDAMSADYGFFYMAADSHHGHYQSVANAGHQTWVSLGYPQNYGSGQYMYAVNGQSMGAPRNKIVGMADNPFVGGGSSGGPWLADYKSGSDEYNYVIGINSFTSPNYPNSMFSPYFDSFTIGLYEHVEKQRCMDTAQ